jgi:anti-sigma factor RsiW
MIESCEQYIAMIAAAVVGDLDADHRRELDVHLSSCGRCAEEYRLYRATIEQMRTSAAAVAPPRHFFVYPEERIRSGGLPSARGSRIGADGFPVAR